MMGTHIIRKRTRDIHVDSTPDHDRMVVHEVGAVQETILSVIEGKIMDGMRPGMETTESFEVLIVHRTMYWCPANKLHICIFA